ncbi:hypothetical protein VTI74DRAFT_7967 [Chaetomium olivicolor]
MLSLVPKKKSLNLALRWSYRVQHGPRTVDSAAALQTTQRAFQWLPPGGTLSSLLTDAKPCSELHCNARVTMQPPGENENKFRRVGKRGDSPGGVLPVTSELLPIGLWPLERSDRPNVQNPWVFLWPRVGVSVRCSDQRMKGIVGQANICECRLCRRLMSMCPLHASLLSRRRWLGVSAVSG